MRQLIIIFALFGVLVASNEIEFDEPSLCVQETNPFSYSHCIKKRDTECQNGGFCGSCNSNSCQTCNGDSCKTTCNGNGCNQCPSGNCCNGQNCNVCSGMNCCNTNNCNSCTNSCNNGCSTFACRSACVQTCQAMTKRCSCNWEQNNCFSTCRDQCIGDHCYESCFKNCNCDRSCQNTTITSVPNVVNQTRVDIENKPVNSNPVNISTIINLKNFIYNNNVIHNSINTTNTQHTIQEKQGNLTVTPPQKCCYVIHPVHCFDIAEPPYKRCIQKRHWECSNICISVVVHLVHLRPEKQVETILEVHEVKQPYPVHKLVPYPVPQPYVVIQQHPVPIPLPQRQRCHYINQFPWIQCGHYSVQGCGPCYVCGNQYNPNVCRSQTTCPGLCRGGIIYDTNIGSQILKYSPTYRAPLQVAA